MNNSVTVLFSAEEIQTRVHELGKMISRDYVGKDPLFVGVLKGCFIFMADLLRSVTIPCEMDFMVVSSYSGAKSTGIVKINKDLSKDISNRHVIIVEDILDTGLTLSYLTRVLQARGAASVKVVTLLEKEVDHAIILDYCGFKCRADAFVIGFGLDYNERYRNLPYIGIFNPKTQEEVPEGTANDSSANVERHILL